MTNDSIFALGTTKLIIGSGATLALFFEAIAGQNATQFKYYSGGTLEIIGVAAGATMTLAELGSSVGNHYLVGTSEILSLDGPVRCYLAATSATTIVMCLRGKTQGT